MIPLPLLTALVAAFLSGAGIWFVQDWRYGEQIAEMRRDTANEVVEALRRNAARVESITTTYQEALNAARSREVVLRRDAAAARAESDGLREQSAETARRLAAAPPAAVLEYAHTTNELLDHCSRRHQELAAKADGHVSDVQTLTGAWPKHLPSFDERR